jgi:heterodisulfide reductase subunit D
MQGAEMDVSQQDASSKDKESIKTRFPNFGKKKRELEEFRDMAWNCVNCNYCQEMWSWDVKSADHSYICPSFAKDRYYAFSARGRSQITRALLEGDFNPADSKRLIDIAFRCTCCGACEMNCLRLMEREPEKMIEALRAYLLERGMLPSHLKAFQQSTMKYDNPFGSLKEDRLKWTEDLGFKIKDLTKEKGEVLLFVGCMYALETRLHKVVKAFAEILNIAGVDFGFLGAEEKCCGIEQFRIGDRGIYEELASDNIKTFNELGIKTLVAACPHCYYSFKSYYPEDGEMNFEVLHFTQYLDRLIKEGKLKLNKLPSQVVTYSDPCNLGRFAGIYNSPREILKAIPNVELREMERNHDQAWCCGAGAGVLTAYPDLATWTAVERVKEAEEIEASTLVTACPWCEYNLESGIEVRKSKLELLDISELVLKSIKEGKG